MAAITQITVKANNTVDSMFRQLRSFDTTDRIAREILQNAIIRRLSTPRNTYWTDPDYGFDVIGLVNESMTAETLARLPLELRAEISKEERVESCQVEIMEISGPYDNRILKLKFYVVPEFAGPFNFTVAVDSLSIQLLTGNI